MTNSKAITSDDGMRVRKESTGTVHAEIPGGSYLTYCGQAILFRGFLTEEDDAQVTCKACSLRI